jgi:hypothetical protein
VFVRSAEPDKDQGENHGDAKPVELLGIHLAFPSRQLNKESEAAGAIILHRFGQSIGIAKPFALIAVQEKPS